MTENNTISDETAREPPGDDLTSDIYSVDPVSLIIAPVPAEGGGFKALAPPLRGRRLPGQWDQLHVQDRLEEAYEVLRRLPMATRPRGHANAMPAYAYSFEDMLGQMETGELERMMKDRNEYRLRGATSAEVARMEQALHWPMEFLSDKPEVAKAVGLGALWAVAKANVADRCRSRRIGRRAFYRRKMFGLKLIAIGLIRGGVPVS